MKTLLLTFVSVLSFTAFSQQKIVYLPYEAVGYADKNLTNIILNLENSSSVIANLKKEIKRREIGADVEEMDYWIGFSNYFEDLNNFSGSESEIYVTGVPDILINTVDTSYNQVYSFGCETRFYVIQNSEGEDSINIDNSGNEYLVGVNERVCDYYYSLDDISGIVLLDGFISESADESRKNGIDKDSYYTNSRIGFVKELNVDSDYFNSNGFDETKNCITFSTTLGNIEKITGVNLEKAYNKMKKYALKKDSKGSTEESGIAVFDITEVNEIANFFHYDALYTEIKDPHMGISIFKY
jgi:hypothetical protein